VKVVLFCGGLGLRLRELSEAIPKPMVTIGYRPILWHVMRYYAHFGHQDFILCLGYRADVIKDYFLHYNEALSNDFVLTGGGRAPELLGRDIDDWRISMVDTGLRANLGQRLRAVEKHLGDDDIFLANYGDTLTDAPLPAFIEDFRAQGKIAAFISVRPSSYSFHLVQLKPGSDRLVGQIEDVRAADVWINGGYFLFRREIFDYIGPGEELVEAPFHRLIERDQLITYRYDGFWAPMDTLKDVQNLETLWESGSPPWALWQASPGDASLAG
jgi:glucose-1-phosphate cytidylyltransferase